MADLLGRSSIEKLSDSNYPVWSKRVQSQLAFAKLWKCIVHEADHKHDVEQDEQAKDIIIRHISIIHWHLSDQHLNHTQDDCDTAAEALAKLWKALKDAFTKCCAHSSHAQAKKLQLNREIV